MNLIVTKDGSSSVELADTGISYHSKHGALSESKHVYITTGLTYFIGEHRPSVISIFEMGFGTGLNALLTYQFAKTHGLSVHYFALDLYPLGREIYDLLNFTNFDNLRPYTPVLGLLHESPWNEDIYVDAHFSIQKITADIISFIPDRDYDLIYYDAFSAADKPEHWTEAIFTRLYQALHVPGMLVTYSSKTTVRRALQAAGFRVEKRPGPHGKRDIVRAHKT